MGALGEKLPSRICEWRFCEIMEIQQYKSGEGDVVI